VTELPPCLTIRQPYASAIVAGIKKVENRSWHPPAHILGQRILIHAGLRVDRDAWCSSGRDYPMSDTSTIGTRRDAKVLGACTVPGNYSGSASSAAATIRIASSEGRAYRSAILVVVWPSAFAMIERPTELLASRHPKV
jgi:hypothetical protein